MPGAPPTARTDLVPGAGAKRPRADKGNPRAPAQPGRKPGRPRTKKNDAGSDDDGEENDDDDGSKMTAMVFVTRIVWDTLGQGPTTASAIAGDLISHCQGDLAGAVAAVSSLRDVGREAAALPGSQGGAALPGAARRRGRGRGAAWSGPGEMNIRRRVYDAIIVLRALHLVTEDANRFLSRNIPRPPCLPSEPPTPRYPPFLSPELPQQTGNIPSPSTAAAPAPATVLTAPLPVSDGAAELEELKARLQVLKNEHRAFTARATELRFLVGFLGNHLTAATRAILTDDASSEASSDAEEPFSRAPAAAAAHPPFPPSLRVAASAASARPPHREPPFPPATSFATTHAAADRRSSPPAPPSRPFPSPEAAPLVGGAFPRPLPFGEEAPADAAANGGNSGLDPRSGRQPVAATDFSRLAVSAACSGAPDARYEPWRPSGAPPMPLSGTEGPGRGPYGGVGVSGLGGTAFSGSLSGSVLGGDAANDVFRSTLHSHEPFGDAFQLTQKEAAEREAAGGCEGRGLTPRQPRGGRARRRANLGEGGGLDVDSGSAASTEVEAADDATSDDSDEGAAFPPDTVPLPGAGDGVVPPFVLQLVRTRGSETQPVGRPLHIDWAEIAVFLRALRGKLLPPVTRNVDGVYTLSSRFLGKP